MYNTPFYIPNYNPNIMNPNLLRGITSNNLLNSTRGLNTINNLANTTRNTNLISKLGTGLSGIKKINWAGLINNTSKTLGIVNQTIPLVKQVGPMIGNMRSMMKVASIFKDETDLPNQKYTNKKITQPIKNTPPPTTKEIKKESPIIEELTSSPTFFINP